MNLLLLLLLLFNCSLTRSLFFSPTLKLFNSICHNHPEHPGINTALLNNPFYQLLFLTGPLHALAMSVLMLLLLFFCLNLFLFFLVSVYPDGIYMNVFVGPVKRTIFVTFWDKA